MRRVSGQTILFSLLAIIALVAVMGLAKSVYANGDGGPSASTFIIPNPLEIKSLDDLLTKIIDFLILIGAPIATIMILYAGLSWILAAGDPQKISKAGSIILWTAVGYGIIIIAKGILEVIKEFFDLKPALTTLPLFAAIASLQDIIDTLNAAVGWFFSFLLILAVLGILYGAYTYITAGGDTEKATKARLILVGSVVGTVIAVFSKTIINLVDKFLRG